MRTERLVRQMQLVGSLVYKSAITVLGVTDIILHFGVKAALSRKSKFFVTLNPPI
jgi:hypothetical protein